MTATHSIAVIYFISRSPNLLRDENKAVALLEVEVYALPI